MNWFTACAISVWMPLVRCRDFTPTLRLWPTAFDQPAEPGRLPYFERIAADMRGPYAGPSRHGLKSAATRSKSEEYFDPPGNKSAKRFVKAGERQIPFIGFETSGGLRACADDPIRTNYGASP